MKRKIAIVLIFSLFSCSERIDIRENEVALTFVNKKADRILQSGQHFVSRGTQFVYYSVGEQTISFDFDFLFKDAAVGRAQFDLTFKPRVDSLFSFLEEYKSDAFSVVVDVKIRMEIRALLENYNKTDLSPQGIQKLIGTTIEKQEGVLRYVELKNASPISVTL